MSDVRQKAKDLLNLALHKETPKEECAAATAQLLKLIEKYDLLSAGGKPIDVPESALQSFLKRVASLDIEDVAGHVEKFASGFERIMAASKRVTGRVGVGDVRERQPGRRRRR